MKSFLHLIFCLLTCPFRLFRSFKCRLYVGKISVDDIGSAVVRLGTRPRIGETIWISFPDGRGKLKVELVVTEISTSLLSRRFFAAGVATRPKDDLSPTAIALLREYLEKIDLDP